MRFTETPDWLKKCVFETVQFEKSPEDRHLSVVQPSPQLPINPPLLTRPVPIQPQLRATLPVLAEPHATADALVASGASSRVALVIGNARYTAVSQLPNTTADATAIAASLAADGFEIVQILIDGSKSELSSALRTFREKADKADWAVVYYAGHGIEIGGVNYLVPVDAHLNSDRDADDEAISLDKVIVEISGARKMRIVILDACRENPFVPLMKRTVAGRGVQRGLGRIEPEGGTIVVYAAKAGETAADGSGDHSPFTGALLGRLSQPGLEIDKMWRLVVADVLQATANKQRPYVYGSIAGGEDFYFKSK